MYTENYHNSHATNYTYPCLHTHITSYKYTCMDVYYIHAHTHNLKCRIAENQNNFIVTTNDLLGLHPVVKFHL